MPRVLQPHSTASPGPWRPLRNSTYRNLLGSNLVSDIGTEPCMFAFAVVLTVATVAGVMTPWLLLLLTLGLSIGDAVESPSWSAIFPELVSKEDLPAALALNGIEFNLARALGPGLGGFIVAAVGVGAAFAFNAFSFL